MRHVLPYPLLSAFLLVMWLLMQQSVAPGQIVLGGLIALFAGRAMAALEPERPKIRKIGTIFRLFFRVTGDIIVSNVAVARIILQGKRRDHHAGFIELPLELRDRTGLALLACILTATPGSAWLEYDLHRNTVLIHVFDLKNEQEWIDTIKNRYESLLLEIFQ